nr:MAG TPA: hypothetical protein [Caudoviricetes sp.]
MLYSLHKDTHNLYLFYFFPFMLPFGAAVLGRMFFFRKTLYLRDILWKCRVI